MQNLRFANRVGILVGMFALSLAAAVFVGPIPQDPAYHLFADTRPWLGISNFGDVASNLGFPIVGGLGLWTVLSRQARAAFEERADAWPYLVFFAGVGLAGAGSAYYHLAPDNARLFWDRLPITLAFMAFFCAVVADRVHKPAGNRYLLPVLILAGVLSLVYWDWTESLGRGDLRFYGLIQFYPVLAIPAICWLFPKARITGGGYLVWVILWYVLAKVLEHFDAEIFDLLGHSVSGHSLKHLAAAVAAFAAWRMLVRGLQARPA